MASWLNRYKWGYITVTHPLHFGSELKNAFTLTKRSSWLLTSFSLAYSRQGAGANYIKKLRIRLRLATARRACSLAPPRQKPKIRACSGQRHFLGHSVVFWGKSF